MADLPVLCLIISLKIFSQEKYNGMDANLSNIYRLSDAKSRSISPENFNGEKGRVVWLKKEPEKRLPGNWGRAGN